MLEYLEGDIAINIGINDEMAYKGGKFVSEFCEAVKVCLHLTRTQLVTVNGSIFQGDSPPSQLPNPMHFAIKVLMSSRWVK